MYAQDSIELLQKSGIQFKKHEEDGIDPHLFAELLTTSGVVFMENVTWLSFHAYVIACARGLLVYLFLRCSSGYDFGYLLKMLTGKLLPDAESEFFELLKIFFPTIYDVKYLMKSCKNLKGGLEEVAKQLEVRINHVAHESNRCFL
jgi:CCR4-NOT transcription complex subunit 7/8